MRTPQLLPPPVAFGTPSRSVRVAVGDLMATGNLAGFSHPASGRSQEDGDSEVGSQPCRPFDAALLLERLVEWFWKLGMLGEMDVQALPPVENGGQGMSRREPLQQKRQGYWQEDASASDLEEMPQIQLPGVGPFCVSAILHPPRHTKNYRACFGQWVDQDHPRGRWLKIFLGAVIFSTIPWDVYYVFVRCWGCNFSWRQISATGGRQLQESLEDISTAASTYLGPQLCNKRTVVEPGLIIIQP